MRWGGGHSGGGVQMWPAGGNIPPAQGWGVRLSGDRRQPKAHLPTGRPGAESKLPSYTSGVTGSPAGPRGEQCQGQQRVEVGSQAREDPAGPVSPGLLRPGLDLGSLQLPLAGPASLFHKEKTAWFNSRQKTRSSWNQPILFYCCFMCFLVTLYGKGYWLFTPSDNVSY